MQSNVDILKGTDDRGISELRGIDYATSDRKTMWRSTKDYHTPEIAVLLLLKPGSCLTISS